MTLLCLDTETTGLRPENEIWQLSVVAFEEKTRQVISEIYLHIRPERLEYLDPKALQMNNLTIEDFNNSVFISKSEAVQVIHNWISTFPATLKFDKVPILGTNPSFDEGMLRVLYQDTGFKYPFSYRKIDLSTIAYFYSMIETGQVDPSIGSLGAITKKLGIDFSAHNARADVYATISAFCHYQDKLQLSPIKGLI